MTARKTRPTDLEQRLGRIKRRGNKNPEVDVYRYITEGTFDAYSYQLIENKQRGISQVFTSKSPSRVMSEIDGTALSYAEIKALATGNPLIVERCEVEAEVNKLKLLKASYLSQKYALEDKLLKGYPQEIKRFKERIIGFEADIEHLAENTPTAPAEKETNKTIFAPMTIQGITYTEKAEAGKAIIAACKRVLSLEPIPLGQYRGFNMELFFDSYASEYRLNLKNTLSHLVILGSDIHGNITRIDNALNDMPERKFNCVEQLKSIETSFESAKANIDTPFQHEQRLNEQTTRLSELTMLLKLDEPDRELLDEEPDETESPEPERRAKEYER